MPKKITKQKPVGMSKMPTHEEVLDKLKTTERELAKLKSEAIIFRNMYSPEYRFSFEDRIIDDL